MRIEIGGGTLPLGINTVNLDPGHGTGEWKRNAQDVLWPVEDNSIDGIRASHVMEHIAAGHDRIAVMNEAWRVLKPYSKFEIYVPLLVSPDGAVRIQAIADPTHVSYWCAESFGYFDGVVMVDADYGIKLWRTLVLDSPRYPWEGRWIGVPMKEAK